MEPNTPQTPPADGGNGNGQPPATPPATPPEGTPPAQPATPAEPTNPPAEPGGTGQQPPALRNNPDGSPPATQPGEPVNYEAKFSESTRENQRLMGLLQTAGIDPKTGQPVQPQGAQPGQQPAQPTEPYNQNPQRFTDEQLNTAIPGFSALTAEEKDVIRYAKNTAKTIADLQRTVAEMYDERKTNQQIEAMKGNEQFKPVADNEQLFRQYAYRPENLSLDIEHVAFKFMQELNAGTLQPTTPTEPQGGNQPPNQPGMEGGTGGNKHVQGGGGEPGVREMTAAEAAELRKTDHRTYNELVRKKQLKIVSR